MKLKHLLLNILGYSTIAVIIFCTVTYFYWRVVPYKTINYLNDPFEVSKTVIKQGEYFTYHIDYCKFTDEVPEITREFVDGIVFTAAERQALIGKGCGDMDVPVKIPETLPPGTYNLRITATYSPNLVRTITKVSQTEEFTVVRTGE